MYGDVIMFEILVMVIIMLGRYLCICCILCDSYALSPPGYQVKQQIVVQRTQLYIFMDDIEKVNGLVFPNIYSLECNYSPYIFFFLMNNFQVKLKVKRQGLKTLFLSFFQVIFNIVTGNEFQSSRIDAISFRTVRTIIENMT